MFLGFGFVWICTLHGVPTAPSVFIFTNLNFLVSRKAAPHKENGGHLLVFQQSYLVGHLHYCREWEQLEVGLPGLMGVVFCVHDRLLT